MEARCLIATNFAEKLTLGSIAKACGLNRTKLARGFRELFDCSIGKALAERRLNWASAELIAGRMPISLCVKALSGRELESPGRLNARSLSAYPEFSA
jgi:AraC-like DNA-binding protein